MGAPRQLVGCDSLVRDLRGAAHHELVRSPQRRSSPWPGRSWDLFIFSIFQVCKLHHARRVWRLSLRCEFGLFFPFLSLSEVVIVPWGLLVLSGWVRRNVSSGLRGHSTALFGLLVDAARQFVRCFAPILDVPFVSPFVA